MISRLKSFGCSFIFGTDLHDDNRAGVMALPSNFTYPALIAREKNLFYSCHARPGAGNFEILNRLIEQLAKGPTEKDSSIYVINWTWIDRFSYIDQNKASGNHPFNPWGWTSIMPIETSALATNYYKKLHTQIRDQLETLICIKCAIDQLSAAGKPFIMTWTDSLIWSKSTWCASATGLLQDQIRPFMSDFDGKNLIDWSRANDFAISDSLHPLERAHESAANLILDNWDSYIRS